MPPKSVKVLILTQKAEVKESHLNTAPNGSISLAMLQALLKKKVAPEMIGSYKNRAQTLFLFGYTTGKAGTENKHELPPPHDTTLCFGDIIILASKDSKSWLNPVPFKAEDYEIFYTRAFGGFEDLDSDDEEEDAPAAEEETEVVEAAEEAEEEEEEDEEEEEEEEAEVEVGEEGDADAEVIPAIPRPLQKKKPRRALTAAAAQAGAAQVYSSYLYVPHEQELLEENFTAAYSVSELPRARQNIHKTIATLFAGYLTESEQNMFERCIYNGSIRAASQRHVGKLWTHKPFVELYSRYAKHIAANFHPNSYVGNTDLYDRYKAGEITFKDISEMDTYQLFEARWTDSFNQQQVREKRQLEGNKEMATDRFLCRCGKRECTYYEMQTRSADEPMTIFITCLACGKHWRQ